MEKPGSTSQLAETATQPMLDLDAAVCSAHTHAVHRNRPSVFAVDQQSIHLDFRVRKTELASAGGMLCPTLLMIRLFYGVPQTSVQRGAVSSSIIIETKYGGDEPITS